MLILALHRRYQRTCGDCGYRWELTRRQAQLMVHPHAQRLRGGGAHNYYSEGALESFEADVDQQDELVEQFKRCARCGSTSYRQRPVTRRHPADAPAAASR